MSRKTMGIRALGLSLLAIAGLMAFTAASASANWLVGGSELGSGTTKPVAVESHKEGNLLVPEETNLEILCSEIGAESLNIVGGSEKVAEASGKVKFNNCKTWQNGVDVSENCTPAQPIVAGGKAAIILQNSKNYVLFAPTEEGGKFAQIKFNPLTCGLPEVNNVKGTLVAECGQLNGSGVFVGENCANASTTHLLQANQTAEFASDVLKYGTKNAFLDGIAEVELTSHESWAGHV